eukprot:TRINITY_DN12037_c0_g1_i1.p1 TRINITY_DN12037_c0_g1~~TRINITY_DN12037_c0_g1_i1.p1  ORF type:complete len:250 (+),score=32.23 TRINITY_DN12037_c0_g1_i1:28-750(+)
MISTGIVTMSAVGGFLGFTGFLLSNAGSTQQPSMGEAIAFTIGGAVVVPFGIPVIITGVVIKNIGESIIRSIPAKLIDNDGIVEVVILEEDVQGYSKDELQSLRNSLVNGNFSEVNDERYCKLFLNDIVRWFGIDGVTDTSRSFIPITGNGFIYSYREIYQKDYFKILEWGRLMNHDLKIILCIPDNDEECLPLCKVGTFELAVEIVDILIEITNNIDVSELVVKFQNTSFPKSLFRVYY